MGYFPFDLYLFREGGDYMKKRESKFTKIIKLLIAFSVFLAALADLIRAIKL